MSPHWFLVLCTFGLISCCYSFGSSLISQHLIKKRCVVFASSRCVWIALWVWQIKSSIFPPQYFTGNRDRNSVVMNPFNPALKCRAVRVVPWGWRSHISMRVELYGCFTGIWIRTIMRRGKIVRGPWIIVVLRFRNNRILTSINFRQEIEFGRSIGKSRNVYFSLIMG